MKRHLFRRIFIIYFIVLLISVFLAESYITSVVRKSHLDNLKNSLFIHAGLISENVSFKEKGGYDALLEKLKSKTGARITLIDNNGRVVGDSDGDPSIMGSHADRPEIQSSLSTRFGSSIRKSRTTGEEVLYVARKILLDGKMQGFVRLAVPLHEINNTLILLRVQISLAVILAFLVSAILLVWQTERIRKFVNQIKDHTGALAHGLFRKRLFMEGAGEFSELAHNLNSMASELETNIKKKEEEMHCLNVILKSIPDALLLINMNGIIELSNNIARDIFGTPHIDNRPYLEVVRSVAFSALVEDVGKNRLSGSAELVLDAPEERHLFVRVSPLSYKVGELAGVVAIFHDTTQLKKLEQMRKDFVANVSHEMKTPITAIKGFAETLLDGAVYDKGNAERFLQTIKVHSERLNRLVEDLMTLSKIELGVIRMKKAEFDISALIDSVLQTFIVQTAEKNLTVKKDLRVLKTTLTADRDRVEQILINLVDNAIKFTDKGEVTVGLDHDESGRDYLFVADTGIGVPARFQERLGERFFRVDNSRSRELGGTGLGLAIVKHLVRAHGWDMKIESEEGRGTVVKVCF